MRRALVAMLVFAGCASPLTVAELRDGGEDAAGVLGIIPPEASLDAEDDSLVVIQVEGGLVEDGGDVISTVDASDAEPDAVADAGSD